MYECVMCICIYVEKEREGWREGRREKEREKKMSREEYIYKYI